MIFTNLVVSATVHMNRKSVLSLVLFANIGLLSACSTVSVDKQTSAKTITEQRGNIATSNNLSTNTSSVLLSAGLNQQACLQSFDLCLDQLTDSMLNEHYRSALAIFAELHYAKARQLNESQSCRNALARPPLDPYYANKPLSAEESALQQQATTTCLLSYQTSLFDAIKASYTYLFYDSLEHDFEGADMDSNMRPQQHRIPNDIDIQTQDIYNAASNDVITQLYDSADKTKIMGANKIKYLSAIDSVAEDHKAAIANRAPLPGKPTDQINVMKIAVDDYSLNIHLPNENNYLKNAHKETSALIDLESTYEMRLSGLNSISKRPGIGVSLVASVDDRYTTTVRQLLSSSVSGKLFDSAPDASTDDSDITSHIYPTGHLLLTGLIEPEGSSVLDVLNSKNLNIYLHNPYRTGSVNILGDDYPLAANFSAGYGLWLAENQLDSVGYLNLFSRQPEASLPKLFMLEPYDPNKRVIIMLHGLASSPATWVNLTNDIFNDNKLRDNYQVWQIFYPTNLPILENRYQIQELLKATYQQTDPNGNNRASRNSVIVSHSMGALIARMMVSDNNLANNLSVLEVEDKKLLTNDNEPQIDDMLKQALSNEELGKRLKLQTLEQVDTAVFLSAPFRGTDYADRWFTRALRRIVYLPVGLVKTVTDNLATIATEGDLSENPLGALYLQNGASQLSKKSSFVELTKDITINERITYHSIIANNDADITQGLAQMQPNGGKIDLSKPPSETDIVEGPDAIDTTIDEDASTIPNTPLVSAVTVNEDISQALTERLSDGIVPYTSAHLDGATSETVITGGHSIQSNPQTILVLRQILHQQLQN